MNYVLLNLVFTSYTIYRYGIKGWLQLVWRDGWKCMLHHPVPEGLGCGSYMKNSG